MASTFKFHSQVGETVPWQATYEFPSQSTRINKQVVKLPSKNGGLFNKNQTIRLEFPSDGYCNMLNSYMLLDVAINKGGNAYATWQRGGAQNLIKRLRILYGSLVIEDIQECKRLVRMLHEAAIPQDYRESFGSILDGMQSNITREELGGISGAAGATRAGVTGIAGTGGHSVTSIKLAASSPAQNDVYANWTIDVDVESKNYRARVASYNGTTKVVTFEEAIAVTPVDNSPYVLYPPTTVGADAVARDICASGHDDTLNNELRRTYCLNLVSGLLCAKKLIPLKWMASQLAIEIVLSTPEEAMLYNTATPPVYTIYEPQYVAEILDMENTYDAAFFAGLASGGVPIRFASWHYHSHNLSGTTNLIQIHERSRSVKAGYAVVCSSTTPCGTIDSDRFYHATGQVLDTGTGILNAGTRQAGSITQFQWRVGGRYYPSQPVRCIYGGAEALVELLKCINYFGDYTTAAAINFYNWTTFGPDATGDRFIIACEFENVDAMPNTIAGINAEEQSDIALSILTNGAPVNKQVDIFMHYDSLLIVRDGNTVDLIM